jgi:hypothetical protein
MYNIKTAEAKLFNSADEYVESEWVDTPDLCDEQITPQEEADRNALEAQADRNALKEEATALGLEFSSNIKTAKLIDMIEVAKGGSIESLDVPVAESGN